MYKCIHIRISTRPFYSPLPAARDAQPAARCPLLAVCCSLSAARCPLPVARCSLPAGSSLPQLGLGSHFFSPACVSVGPCVSSAPLSSLAVLVLSLRALFSSRSNCVCVCICVCVHSLCLCLCLLPPLPVLCSLHSHVTQLLLRV
jgi:hypothetical protein